MLKKTHLFPAVLKIEGLVNAIPVENELENTERHVYVADGDQIVGDGHIPGGVVQRRKRKVKILGKPKTVPHLIVYLVLPFLRFGFEVLPAHSHGILERKEIVDDSEIDCSHLPHERFSVLVREVCGINSHRVDAVGLSGVSAAQCDHDGIPLDLGIAQSVDEQDEQK